MDAREILQSIAIRNTALNRRDALLSFLGPLAGAALLILATRIFFIPQPIVVAIIGIGAVVSVPILARASASMRNVTPSEVAESLDRQLGTKERFLTLAHTHDPALVGLLNAQLSPAIASLAEPSSNLTERPLRRMAHYSLALALFLLALGAAIGFFRQVDEAFTVAQRAQEQSAVDELRDLASDSDLPAAIQSSLATVADLIEEQGLAKAQTLAGIDEALHALSDLSDRSSEAFPDSEVMESSSGARPPKSPADDTASEQRELEEASESSDSSSGAQTSANQTTGEQTPRTQTPEDQRGTSDPVDATDGNRNSADQRRSGQDKSEQAKGEQRKEYQGKEERGKEEQGKEEQSKGQQGQGSSVQRGTSTEAGEKGEGPSESKSSEASPDGKTPGPVDQASQPDGSQKRPPGDEKVGSTGVGSGPGKSQPGSEKPIPDQSETTTGDSSEGAQAGEAQNRSGDTDQTGDQTSEKPGDSDTEASEINRSGEEPQADAKQTSGGPSAAERAQQKLEELRERAKEGSEATASEQSAGSDDKSKDGSPSPSDSSEKDPKGQEGNNSESSAEQNKQENQKGEGDQGEQQGQAQQNRPDQKAPNQKAPDQKSGDGKQTDDSTESEKSDGRQGSQSGDGKQQQASAGQKDSPEKTEPQSSDQKSGAQGKESPEEKTDSRPGGEDGKSGDGKGKDSAESPESQPSEGAPSPQSDRKSGTERGERGTGADGENPLQQPDGSKRPQGVPTPNENAARFGPFGGGNDGSLLEGIQEQTRVGIPDDPTQSIHSLGREDPRLYRNTYGSRSQTELGSDEFKKPEVESSAKGQLIPPEYQDMLR